MDVTADILRAMHLTGGIFLDAEFTAPWCVSSKIGPGDCEPWAPTPRSIIAFHYVSSGRLQLQAHGEPPMTVGAREIVALPRNDDHIIGSKLSLQPVSADALIQPGADGRLAHICHGGGGETTRIVCGFLGTARENDPVLLMLPKVMKLGLDGDASAAWIDSSFHFAAQEAAAGSARMSDMLTRLAELLFTEAVRRYLDTLTPQQSEWCAGLPDPRIAQALALLHEQLKRRWTTEDLAHAIGLSRSAFADRFSRAMGESPMRYLARERLRVAARRLKSSQDSLARIAFEVGYESEAAFSRAFKREYGTPPASWRCREPIGKPASSTDEQTPMDSEPSSGS